MNNFDDDPGYKKWRKSVELPNGSEKSLCVNQIENGFIITLRSTSIVNGDYKCTEKKMFSKTNPLKNDKPELTEKDIDSFLNPPIELI